MVGIEYKLKLSHKTVLYNIAMLILRSYFVQEAGGQICLSLIHKRFSRFLQYCFRFLNKYILTVGGNIITIFLEGKSLMLVK